MWFSCLLVLLALVSPLFAVLVVSSAGVDVLSKLEEANQVIHSKLLQRDLSFSFNVCSFSYPRSVSLLFIEFAASFAAFSLFLSVLSSSSLFLLFAAPAAIAKSRRRERSQTLQRVESNLLTCLRVKKKEKEKEKKKRAEMKVKKLPDKRHL